MGARRKITNLLWLAERKEILHKIKGQVRLYLGEEPEDLQRYALAYKEDIGRPWSRAKLQDIHVRLQQVDVALGGDFHPFAQAQRAHLRIIREIVSERPMILGLECVFAQDQDFVDQYCQGLLSEGEFLKKVEWDQKWGFPWRHYKPLFDFAIKNKLKVLALNVEVGERTSLSLDHRDQIAAEHISSALKEYPDHLIYAIYGDLHIAQKHLPKFLKAQSVSGKNLEVLSIYLNSESIYFELMKDRVDSEVEVVRFNDNEFCVLSSPPWVKWQSYLMYLEENFDVDLDIEDDDDDEWEFQIDHTDHVSDLVKMIGGALGVHFKCDDIEVYSLNDPQVLIASERILSKQDFTLALELVQADRSFYIPKDGFFYLSKSTVNHAATLAGQYVHSKFCNRKSQLWCFPQNFLALIWSEAMSFFLSKLVNPKRKAQTMADLKKQLQAFDSHDKGREPLLLALDQKMSELLVTYGKEKRQDLYKPSEKSSYVHAAKFIGEILGERYFLLFQQQAVDVQKIIGLLEQDLGEESFETFYYNQLRLLDQLETSGEFD